MTLSDLQIEWQLGLRARQGRFKTGSSGWVNVMQSQKLALIKAKKRGSLRFAKGHKEHRGLEEGQLF